MPGHLGGRDIPLFKGVKIINPDPTNPRSAEVGIATTRGAEPVTSSGMLTIAPNDYVEWGPNDPTYGVECVYVTMVDAQGNTVDFGDYGVGRELKEDGQMQYIENVEVTWSSEWSELWIVYLLDGDSPPRRQRSATQGVMGTNAAQRIVSAAYPELALQLPFVAPTSTEDPQPIGMRNGIAQGTFASAAEQQVSSWNLANEYPPGGVGAHVYSIESTYASAEGSAKLAQWQGAPQGLAGEYVQAGANNLPYAQGWRFIWYQTYAGTNSPTADGTFQIVNVGGLIVANPDGTFTNDTDAGNGCVLVSLGDVAGAQCVFLPPDTATGTQSQFWNVVNA